MKRIVAALAALLLTPALAACGGSDADLVVYSGRSEELVGPLIERFEASSGLEVDVRYGDSAELAATLLEERDAGPADVFFSQDAGALGALQKEGLLAPLPRPVLDSVEARWRSPRGAWVGVSGRARVVAYDKRRLRPADLPDRVEGFTDSRWRGRIGWAPTNASFQSFVTALRRVRGEAAAERWLRGIVANRPERFENNIAVRDAIARGEIEVGFINHYYVAEAVAEEGPDYPVGVRFMRGGDPGALVNAAGVAVLRGADHRAAALRFVRYLLSRPAQEFFARETREYPLAAGVRPARELVPLERIQSPRLDLSDLDDLEGTEELIRRSGAL